ncbi:M23 family metallopeptidase [Micromonospora sp. Llam7]|nr:M23 family metallopeptidase [Micromonospora tarapacensis]
MAWSRNRRPWTVHPPEGLRGPCFGLHLLLKIRRRCWTPKCSDSPERTPFQLGVAQDPPDPTTTITGTDPRSDGSPAAENCHVTGPWIQPIHAPVGSGFRTAARPGHDGVDLAAPRGTTIRAASTGTVTQVRCNAIHRRDGRNWGCHRDGNPHHTSGCGWYVDIQHDQGIITRYCHMDKPPPVQPGQPVTVGQPIGIVGSTGHSSGPHLHYEIHTNGDSSSTGAQDPVPFMIAVGAPLGESPR